ncbi:hypothetical protein [Campylobacter blaseri]|nr:hypothetical protein [Campylobacter blaseri]
MDQNQTSNTGRYTTNEAEFYFFLKVIGVCIVIGIVIYIYEKFKEKQNKE